MDRFVARLTNSGKFTEYKMELDVGSQCIPSALIVSEGSSEMYLLEGMSENA